MHSDLVFEASVPDDIMACVESRMKISSTTPLLETDFKAIVHDSAVEVMFKERETYKCLLLVL